LMTKNGQMSIKDGLTLTSYLHNLSDRPCYGYTYDKTNRIICAMMVHFGLNLFHLMLFSYPAANI
ncbi:MAG: hypothetical protein ACE1S7_06395, partial [Candidatus Tisiphia sp.]